MQNQSVWEWLNEGDELDRLAVQQIPLIEARLERREFADREGRQFLSRTTAFFAFFIPVITIVFLIG